MAVLTFTSSRQENRRFEERGWEGRETKEQKGGKGKEGR